MALTLEQQPRFRTLPVGDNVIFSVMDESLFTPSVKTRVKYIAEVYVDNNKGNVQANTAGSLVATLKTTPNAAGRGIFDLRPILESFVSPDYVPHQKDIPPLIGTIVQASTYKGVASSDHNRFPIHLLDMFSMGDNFSKYFKVKFTVEFLQGTSVAVQSGNLVSSDEFYFFNGYVKHTNVLQQGQVGNAAICYGLNLLDITDATVPYDPSDISTFTRLIQNGALSSFISNAPTTQYARLKDYGTIAMFNNLTQNTYDFLTGSNNLQRIYQIKISLYNSSDVQLGSTIVVNNNTAYAGSVTPVAESPSHILYYGAFPANLTGAYAKDPTLFADWNTHKANVSYYTIVAFSNTGAITQDYTINILCTPEPKGYTPIRLTWLNQWGTWDYYTFNKKSVRQFNTNKTTYTQLGGTWNEVQYKPDGWNGGKKAFRVNNKESITINTDFINELESKWFEELINSPEVYILNQYQLDAYASNSLISEFTNKYVEAVLLKTSSYTKKTRANDNLIQYTFELERNIDQRTQSI